MLTAAITFFGKFLIIWGIVSTVAFCGFLLLIKYGKFPTHYEPEEIEPLDEYEEKIIS